MSTITIGADVDLKTNSKALKIDTLNHYANNGNASPWLDNTNFSGYTESAVSNEYPLTGALEALATYAATVGPSATVDTSFDTADNVHPATQAAIHTHLGANYAPKNGNNGNDFAADALTAKKTLAEAPTGAGLQLGSDAATGVIRLVIKDDSFIVYKNTAELFKIT